MNKQRREKIREVRSQIESCKDKLQIILDEEQDYFDNMPENLQGSMRGSDSEDAIDTSVIKYKGRRRSEWIVD